MLFTRILFVLGEIAATHAAATIQGKCVSSDRGLSWLASQLSSNAVISCAGQPLQLYNAGRYWGTQYGKNASVVVFPTTASEVASTMNATLMTPLGTGFAFAGGAHGQTGAAASSSFVIDLSWLNATRILPGYVIDGTSYDIIAMQGGAVMDQVYNTTYGTGFSAILARISSVGVGGFFTGGGIGYLAGAYGYAMDRLRAMEVVLPSGQIVMATKSNQYSDLFWALQGGGGQFGIVTQFFQEAIPELTATISAFYLDNSTATSAKAIQNTVTWFNNNQDPFSLMYYVYGVLPSSAAADPATFALRPLLVALQFNNPSPSARQQSFNATYQPLLQGLTPVGMTAMTTAYSYLPELFDPSFPYGFRRGFYGPQVQNVSQAYLSAINAEMSSYVLSLELSGETAPSPASTLWALQYMYPTLNGNAPSSDTATAWPHHNTGHQTLFSPAYNLASNDALTSSDNAVFDQLTHTQQSSVGPFLADYPNYISPTTAGSRVWAGNIPRLIQIKQKYDPQCSIHNGRVFASTGCIAGGWANVYPSILTL